MMDSASLQLGMFLKLGIQTLNCMEQEDFQDVFGESHGSYLWNKFKEKYKGDTGEFICYLSPNNCALLAAYVRQKSIEYLASQLSFQADSDPPVVRAGGLMRKFRVYVSWMIHRANLSKLRQRMPKMRRTE